MSAFEIHLEADTDERAAAELGGMIATPAGESWEISATFWAHQPIDALADFAQITRTLARRLLDGDRSDWADERDPDTGEPTGRLFLAITGEVS